MRHREDTLRGWITLLILTVLAIYLYILMEWLFFVTKRSFMSNLGFMDRLQTLWITPAPFVLLAAVTLLVFWLPSMLVRRSAARKICLAIGLLMPSVALALTLFLLIDNFTYTIFHFGVTSTRGYQNLVYGFLVLVLVGFSYQALSDFRKKLTSSALYRRLGFMALGLFAVSVIFTIAGFEDFHLSLHRRSFRERADAVIPHSDPEINRWRAFFAADPLIISI